MTPPVATNGRREKLRALARDEWLISPSMAATATLMQELIRPAKARINAHMKIPVENPILLILLAGSFQRLLKRRIKEREKNGHNA